MAKKADYLRLEENWNMYYCGREKCSPGHSYGPAVRDHFLFKYIRAGRGVFRQSHKTFHLGQGSIFFLFPDHLAYYEADRDEPWEYMWIGFNGEHIAEHLRRSGITPAHPTHHMSEGGRLCELFSELLGYRQLSETHEKVYTTGLLYLIFSEVIRDKIATGSSPDYRNPGENEYIQKAVKYISLNYDKEITVSSIADHVGLERSYFTKKFKQVTSKTPHDFLMEYRITRAATLLTQTDMLIKHIANSVGFSSQFYFSRTFKKYTGESPSSFRQKKSSSESFVFCSPRDRREVEGESAGES